MPRRRLAPAAAAALLVLCLAAPPASAVSRGRATAAALKALKSSHPTIVFGLPRPLKASQRVGVTLLPGQRARAVPRLGARTWLFWGEQVCGAEFPHSSRLVLVDDRSGRVRSSRALVEEPTIDGRVPPFLATPAAYASSRYRVVSSNLCVQTATARGAGTPPGWQSGLPPTALLNDCMVLVGDPDPEWSADFQAMTGWADDVGLRHTTAAPSMAGLRKAVGAFAADTADPCRDVLVYIAGHGVPPPDVTVHEAYLTRKFTPQEGGGAAAIAVHYRGSEATGDRRPDAFITPAALVKLVDDYAGKVTFKFKIGSCFAGRFEHPLADRPNVRVVEMSSRSDETSIFHTTNAVGRDSSGNFYPPDDHDAKGIPLWRPDHLVDNATTNPLGADEFTNGNVAGLYAWAQHPTMDVDLAEGVAQAAKTGQTENFAVLAGYTHVVVTPLRLPGPESPGAAFQVFTHSGWAHDDPSPPDGGLSTVCVDATTSPAQQPGDAVSADMTTGPGIVTRHIDAKLAASGAVHLRLGISAPGHYDGTVTIDGVTATFSVDVPSPTGTTPDHGGEAGSSCP